MSKIKQLATLVAATMAMAGNSKSLYDEREVFEESKFF
jgi:hypothetical protein